MSNGKKEICLWDREWEDELYYLTNEEEKEFYKWLEKNKGQQEYIIPTQNKKIRDLCIKAIICWNEYEDDEE